MDIHRHYLKSPLQIITTQLGIPQEYKQQCIDELYRLGDSMNQSTVVKAIMTSFRIWEETSVFDLLLNKIKKKIDTCYPVGDPRYKYKFYDTWGAIYKKGYYTVGHHHLPSMLSYVYYLKSSGATPLIFGECEFTINPLDDMLVIFPSYLVHSVPKHMEEENRIVIAGNLDWVHIKAN